MTTKVKGTEGIEFPDSTVQGTAADKGPAFKASRATNQNITSATPTKCLLPDELLALSNSGYDPVLSRFTPNVPGVYSVQGSIWGRGTNIGAILCEIRKNGVEELNCTSILVFSGPSVVNVSGLVKMNGTTDYLELWGQVNGTDVSFGGSNGQTFLSAALVRIG